jgi:hypothetical protein
MHVAFKKGNTGNKSSKTFLKNSGKSQILLINLLSEVDKIKYTIKDKFYS